MKKKELQTILSENQNLTRQWQLSQLNFEKFKIEKQKEIEDLKNNYERRILNIQQSKKDGLDILETNFDLYKAEVVRMMTKIDDISVRIRGIAQNCGSITIGEQKKNLNEIADILFNIVNPALGIEMEKMYAKMYDKNDLKIQIEKSVIEIRSLIEGCGGCGTIKINIYSETDNLLKLLI
jgi:hypothetical protein